MSDHTPGPWYLSDREVRQEKSCRAICEIYRGGKYEPDVITAMYNAALIAAAPDLLHELQLARDMIMVSFENIIDSEKVEHLARIKAAIAKAQGVTPCQP